VAGHRPLPECIRDTAWSLQGLSSARLPAIAALADAAASGRVGVVGLTPVEHSEVVDGSLRGLSSQVALRARRHPGRNVSASQRLLTTSGSRRFHASRRRANAVTQCHFDFTAVASSCVLMVQLSMSDAARVPTR
jgi:hypothetical protein